MSDKTDKKQTLLLVDDELFASRYLVDHLKWSGFEVLTARTVNEAKNVISSTHVDLAIIDIILPIGKDISLDDPDFLSARGGYRSGQLLAAWIKEHHPSMRFVAFSISSEHEIVQWFNKHGDGFFRKAFVEPDDLVNRIRNILNDSIAPGPKFFIVHGHDDKLKYELKNYIQNTLGFQEPIILHEQPSLGRTIIEKFEQEAEEVQLVFVLLTPDDKGGSVDATDDEKRRARQNVIFEMGYFLGKFGREKGRVFFLHKGPLELPSDISGLVYIDISKGIEAAGETIRREVSAINKILNNRFVAKERGRINFPNYASQLQAAFVRSQREHPQFLTEIEHSEYRMY